jgi:hypothetical protein
MMKESVKQETKIKRNTIMAKILSFRSKKFLAAVRPGL